MNARIQDLYHYPIKGLSAQKLDAVTLAPGKGFPLDRVFGFARPGSGFDPAQPTPLPKSKFVVLARDAMLAKLGTAYDDGKKTLTISDGRDSHVFSVDREGDRLAAARFIAACLGMPEDAAPTLCSAEPHRFTDVSVVSPAMMNAVSLINADSVSHFSDLIDQEVSATRFRGNIVFSGAPAFSELGWVGQELSIGQARLKVVMRTKRCAATQVNLSTGERDIDVPALLRKNLGHFDMGVYAQVTRAGRIAPSDTLRLI